MGEALIPSLVNQHSWVPLHSVCTLLHAGQGAEEELEVFVQSLWDHRDVVGQLTGLESCHGWIQALQEGQAGTARLGVTLSVREQWGYMELWLWTDESQWRACRS